VLFIISCFSAGIMEKDKKNNLVFLQEKAQERENETEGEGRVGIEQIKKKGGGCGKKMEGKRGKGKLDGEKDEGG
jgi:hypothetical protein